MHPYREFVNPHLGKLLSQINMDKSYIRGKGCYLYDSEGNRYLDFIAAYGALPFGFNPPEIWKALTDIRDSGEPSFIQPSALNAAGELARRLVELAPEGIKYVTFTNSGAEAVEAAFKLCRAATGRFRILSTKNSFHGKTMGALSATGRESYQKAFGAPVEGFDFIPYGDIEALEKQFMERGEKYAAFIIEPIQGEGGIVVPPPGYISEAKKLCEKFGVLLILDEIQTGLGRTGKMFACEEEGVSPDVILLAKALGGGLIPVGACLCTGEAYTEEFAMKHSSTFAANSLAARAGLAALNLLSRNDKALIKDVERKGQILKKGLLELQTRYPETVKSIRGRGLMLGIEFGINRDTFPNSFLGIMAEQELLTPIISGYLLNVEHLRVAPTLNGNSVIRIEPPLIVNDSHCKQALDSIDNMLRVLSSGNTAQLLSHLLGKKGRKVVSFNYKKKKGEKVLPSEDPEEGRFAFLVHPINMRNYSEFDDSLSVFNEDEMSRLAERWNDMVEPFVVSETRIVSKSGKTAYGEFISVPRTADEMVNMPKEQILEELKAAVKLAKERGARIVGLGAYTSVVSRGGQWLTDEGIPVTTGNSYTVVAAVEAVNKALTRLGLPLNNATAAVVGATGAIGRATSILLSENISELVLIGNPRHPGPSKRRLQKVAAEVCRHIAGLIKSGNMPEGHTIGAKLLLSGQMPDVNRPIEEFIEFIKGFKKGETPIIITTDIDKILPLADIVITATSSVNKLITPQNLKRGAAVCDLSRPGNVSREVKKSRPDVLVFDGGVIEVPGRPSLGWNFGFEEGLSYACMAETMMLALEHHYEHTSIGSDLNLETILYLRELAEKHGFKLANLQSFDLPLSDEEWQSICRARNELIEENKLIRTV